MFLYLFCICQALQLTFSFDVPPARVEIYTKGLQASIPALPGITLFGFHGKINEEFEADFEGGIWGFDFDVHKPKNGRFTFVDKKIQLKRGDILYYWTYVVHNGIGYREEDGKIVVSQYANKNDGSSSTPSVEHIIISTTQPSSVCHKSETTVNKNSVACNGELIFEEHFSGNQLNLSKWSYEHRFSTEPDFEFVMYAKDSDALQIENDLAKIKAYRRKGNDKRATLSERAFDFGPDCTGQPDTDECVRTQITHSILPPLISTQFSTKKSFNFRYGRVEVRARLPKSDWVFPQITLEPATFDRYGKTEYQSGQIRIAFTEGSTTCSLKGGVLLNSNRPFRTTEMCNKQCSYEEWSKDFHIYKLNWTPELITLSVDDVEYCSIDPGRGFEKVQLNDNFLPNAELLRRGSKMAPFDQEFYLNLGYGVGGLADFPDGIPDKPWRNDDSQPVFKFWKTMINKPDWLSDEAAELRIDYVKIFSV